MDKEESWKLVTSEQPSDEQPLFCVCEIKKKFLKLKGWPGLVHLNVLYRCCQILRESPIKYNRKDLFQPGFQPPEGFK